MPEMIRILCEGLATVCTHLYALSLQNHEETGLSLCPVASVCADRVWLSDAVPAWRTVPMDIPGDRISVCASVCVDTGLYKS